MSQPARKYTYNGDWNGRWTKAMEQTIRDLKDTRSVHGITDALTYKFGGPARWESTRDKMKEMFPGEMVKGDEDDPDAAFDSEDEGSVMRWKLKEKEMRIKREGSE